MSINLNENEYQKVLADIEADLESVLKSESDALSKAFPPGDDDAAGSPEASAGGESADAAPAESSDAPPAEGSESAPADASAPPDASASPDAAPPGADPAAGGGEEDLESKLMNLPEEQLRHLYMAAKQALFARMSQQGAPGAGGPPGAPPAPGAAPGMPPDASAAPAGAPPGIGAPPPAAPPAADPSQMPPPAMKSDAGLGLMKPKSTGEMSSNKANGGPGPGAVKLGKSEEAPVKESEEMAEMKQKLELMAKAMNLVFGQPMRKAITGISQLSHLPKNDGSNEKVEVKLSKAQITDKLKALDQAKLTKSDRLAINQYYNKFEVGGIAHLLK